MLLSLPLSITRACLLFRPQSPCTLPLLALRYVFISPFMMRGCSLQSALLFIIVYVHELCIIPRFSSSWFSTQRVSLDFLFAFAFPLESNLFLLLDGLASTDSTISLQYVSSLKDTLSYILVFNKRLTLKCAILSPSRMQLRHISTTLYYIYQFSTHYDFAIS